MAYGFYQIGQGNHRAPGARRRREKLTARAVLVPFLQAEEDRRYHRAWKERTAVEDVDHGGRRGVEERGERLLVHLASSAQHAQAQDHLTKDDPSASRSPSSGRCTVVICITYNSLTYNASSYRWRLACASSAHTPSPSTPTYPPWLRDRVPHLEHLVQHEASILVLPVPSYDFPRRAVPSPRPRASTAPAHVPNREVHRWTPHLARIRPGESPMSRENKPAATSADDDVATVSS